MTVFNRGYLSLYLLSTSALPWDFFVLSKIILSPSGSFCLLFFLFNFQVNFRLKGKNCFLNFECVGPVMKNCSVFGGWCVKYGHSVEGFEPALKSVVLFVCVCG